MPRLIEGSEHFNLVDATAVSNDPNRHSMDFVAKCLSGNPDSSVVVRVAVRLRPS